MFVPKASTSFGNDRAKISPLKKACWTSGQFGAFVTTTAINPKTTMVLTSAIRLERRASPGGTRRRERRGPLEPASPMSSPVSTGPPVSDMVQAAMRPVWARAG